MCPIKSEREAQGHIKEKYVPDKERKRNRRSHIKKATCIKRKEKIKLTFEVIFSKSKVTLVSSIYKCISSHDTKGIFFTTSK
ncbi:hypothetical protein UB32_11445 [Mesobacillus subterraneus]|uniref:Uncharacterized protein n=1 Tax=Mesobacillus subterraneus TaxID=285983 RepID=A0A0D6ZBG4_9BACI|nr:hypothetical protein UB32_11445 [Mesobacillus subterraneus]